MFYKKSPSNQKNNRATREILMNPLIIQPKRYN